MVAAVAYGAPGVYFAAGEPPRSLRIEAMDVAAFVGVAPRGPAWEPVDDPTLVERGVTHARSVAVPVESWDEYVEHFGAFEGRGLLPHAVAAFFDQGGRRAYVVRVVHDELDRSGPTAVPFGCARLRFPAPMEPLGTARVGVRARNEGSWGDRLRARLRFQPVTIPVREAEPSALVFTDDVFVPVGSLLRVTRPDGVKLLRTVTSVRRRGRRDGPARDLVAALDGPVGPLPARAERVEVSLEVTDDGADRLRTERFTGLGLRPFHPRWLGEVLRRESRLVDLDGEPTGIDVLDVTLPDVEAVPDGGGEDRWHLVTHADLFGDLLLGDEAGTQGLDALSRAPEVASVVVADLYAPAEPVDDEPVVDPPTFAGPAFARCEARPAVRHPRPDRGRGLDGLRLDPTVPTDLAQVVALQQEVVRTAEALGCVALLDVPPGLQQRGILRWRSQVSSAFAAAYHPWLRRPERWPDGRLHAVNPAAVAAGIIARTELRHGIPHGPANEPAASVVGVLDEVDEPRHGELHQHGVDVFRLEPDAVWLMGARTLSSDPAWRQLSVRRLVSMLERAVLHQLQWLVFEPNSRALRVAVEDQLARLLEELFLLGAFAGATPAESYFVRTADERELVLETDRGQLVCEIGVAPSEPLEFIVIRLSHDADGNLRTEAVGG